MDSHICPDAFLGLRELTGAAEATICYQTGQTEMTSGGVFLQIYVSTNCNIIKPYCQGSRSFISCTHNG